MRQQLKRPVGRSLVTLQFPLGHPGQRSPKPLQKRLLAVGFPSQSALIPVRASTLLDYAIHSYRFNNPIHISYSAPSNRINLSAAFK